MGTIDNKIPNRRHPNKSAEPDNKLLAITLWPHRSCSRTSFRLVIAMSAVALLLPSSLMFNSSLALHILPFSLVVILLFYLVSEKNFRDGRLQEKLWIDPKTIKLDRQEPKGNVKSWSANPYWTEVKIRADGPVESYLTLKGNGREVEVGSFLTPWEREELKGLIEEALKKTRTLNYSS